MNLTNISLNLYSFGYCAGFIDNSNRSREILGIDELIKLVDEAQYRKVLFQKLVKYNFSLNKATVLDSINSLI